MALFRRDTIVALATAPLPAGVAVVRLSGPEALAAARQLMPKLREAKAREMVFGALVHEGETLDHALGVYFKNPHSFTGEDVVELHCHGGRAVVQSVIAALQKHPHVRHAEAGEFTRRAFLNGKMDLTQAEGLGDLIAAETEAQRQQALRQLQGELGQRFEWWRQQVMHLLAHVEAALDFPDEELEVLEEAGLKHKAEALLKDIQNAITTRSGERLRDGFSVAIVGKPNAGKSTLTNLLTGKDTAIVSPIAGTTRDVVEAHLNIQGYPVVLADTAGIRESTDVIEQEGVRRATARAENADLVLHVVEAGEWPALDKNLLGKIQPQNMLLVVSKLDQAPALMLPTDTPLQDVMVPVLGLNLSDARSLDILLPWLAGAIEKRIGSAREAAQITRARHRAALQQASEHLQRALDLYAKGSGAKYSLSDLLAQDFRDAAKAIGSVTGKTDVEDVLDLVFSTFCIGK
jgi:tRNA modification GTPase